MSKKDSPNKPKAATVAIPADPNALRKLKISLGAIIGVFAFLLYAQSIRYDYTMDDHTVIDLNKITTKGLAGVSTLLKTDYWYGYLEENRGPVYRPASLIIYAIVWQFSPNSPHIYHLINVLLYSITCLILFIVLCKLFEKQNLLFPFVCSLLYAAHPIHTEVVNNIKSLDEILCFLFAILSIWFFLKNVSSPSILSVILGSSCFFVSLISKESGITFLLIIPLMLFVFTRIPLRKLVLISFVLILITSMYLLIRMEVLKATSMHVMDSVLNNTLAIAPDFISREATVFYILLKYIWLLIFPYLLSCDYSYSTIIIQTISNPIPLFGIILIIGLLGYSVINIRKKNIVAFGILFFLISLAPVSNMFILIGATMAERFLYVPSLGFCVIITFFLIKFTRTEFVKSKFQNLIQMIRINSSLFLIVFIIAGLYSIRTFSRNINWKDNATIYGHDSEVSENSATVHYCYGHELLQNLYQNEKDPQAKNNYLEKAIVELTKAVAILPTFRDAYYYLGIAYSQKGNSPDALANFEKALNNYVNPDGKMLNDLGQAYLNAGQLDKAIIYIDSSIKVSPDNFISYENKGVALLKQSKYEQSIPLFQKSLHLYPKSENSLLNLGCAYYNLKQYPNALENFTKALEIDSTNYQTNELLGFTYGNMGDTANSKYYSEKSKRYKKI